jgi:hypothetical protein
MGLAALATTGPHRLRLVSAAVTHRKGGCPAMMVALVFYANATKEHSLWAIE